MVGKVLGNRYRVLREIGSGGMAWVYLAEDINEDELVAIKILYPQFSVDISYIQRFNREAKLASTLTDSHIVRVLDYGADRDIHYLVMEYIEGQELREILKEKGPFPWRNALDIIDQLATALEHAHLHGVVHRDIKPQNIMLTDNGLVKVLDFGIARIPTLPSLTQSGFIGSPYYVSPEQAMSEEVDIRADIYSSGIVLYELVSGDIPFDAKSPWSIISQHISSELPRIDFSKNVNVPEDFNILLERMVAKQPEDRFQTPTALRRAIAAVLSGQPLPDRSLDTQPITPPEQVDMANSLYQRALETMRSEDWARAADLLHQTLKLDPKHTQASAKLPEVEEKAFLSSLYNASKRAIKANRWEEAINSLNGIKEIDSEYKDIEKLLDEAHRELEKDNAQQYITTRYNEGVAHFEAQHWKQAIEALEDVQNLSPGYERTTQLLTKARQLDNPSLLEKIGQFFPSYLRWASLLGGIILIVAILLFLNMDILVTGNDDPRQQLKALYTEAQTAIENEEIERAIDLFDQILEQNPDYADVATVRREMIISLTPTPTSTPTPEPTATPTATTQDILAAQIEQAQGALNLGQWTEALDILQEIRAENPEQEQVLVTTLFCEAYVNRGLETLDAIGLNGEDEVELVQTALNDFEAGRAECPRRVDLRDQTTRANAYLEALNIASTNYDDLIQILTPVVAANPNYVGGNAKERLYQAYLHRGNRRSENEEIVGALGDYEAALALNVSDPSEAQTRRAELLIQLQKNNQPTPLPSPTPRQRPTVSIQQSDEATSTPTSSPPQAQVEVKYEKPQLTNPKDDASFAGQFDAVVLEWEGIEELAEDEYYDLTIMHIFADQPTYWGQATRETDVKLIPSEIGVGQAGGDRFYWWVTIRKANSAPTEDSIDLPVSPQSEIRTFVWTL